MDELELIRRAFSDVPERDPEAKERARGLLRAEMGSDLASVGQARRRPRPRLVWLAAAASVAAVLLLVQVLLPPRQGGPDTSAATELGRLADLSSSQGAIGIAEDQFLYTRLESLQSHSGGIDPVYRLLVSEVVETWRSNDGSGRRVTTINEVSFASDEDRSAWVAAGRPDLPQSGDVQITRFQPGDFLPNLSGVPTDPNELRALLVSGRLLDQSPGEENLALAIGELFEQGGADPDLRAALFEILADLSAVTNLGRISDHLDRGGIGFSVPEGNGGARWFIFDRDTASFLEGETLQPGETEPSSWETLTDTAVVGDDHERPGPA